ncbi:SDR family oxidoreductase [Pollutibacter soli]|uniref:SDR family oxidoreductase n=1 Tax=Pollutibacter soli TaxID=3034157 RepID=UPI003013CA6E
MNLSLNNKTALICGSSQGIGLAVAQELAGLGANCVLLARNEEVLRTAVQSLSKKENQEHQYLIADFADPEKVRSVVYEFLNNRKIDILINNSGGPKPGLISTAATTEFENAFRQHVVNNQNLALAVIPGMKESGYGRIINIISTSVRVPLKNLGVSNTIRAAVASWAKTLSNEIGQFGITVNSVLPGFTKTERLNSMIENNAKQANRDVEQLRSEMEADVPLRRFGEPSEIATMVAFLATPAASYVNGISIPVDGGRTGTI